MLRSKNVLILLSVLFMNSCFEKSQTFDLNKFKVLTYVNLISVIDFELLNKRNIFKDGLVQGVGLNVIPLAKFSVLKKDESETLCLSYRMPYLTNERDRYGIMKLYRLSNKSSCVESFNLKEIVSLKGILSLRFFLGKSEQVIDEKKIAPNTLFLEISLKGIEKAVIAEFPLLNVLLDDQFKRFSTGETRRLNSGILYLPN